MKKVSLLVVAFLVSICCAFSQKNHIKKDTSTYQPRKLALEEVNLVSGYYQQTGNHAAVTGGLGSEALTDFANNIDLKFSGVALNGNKHSLALDMGIDHYTSASSDKIDPRERRGGGGGQIIDSALLVATNLRTSAYYEDTRFYPSLSWNIDNSRKNWTLNLGASYSTEWDYESKGLSANFTKASKDGNRELSLGAGAFLDKWGVILPVELRTNQVGGGHDDDDEISDNRPRNTFQTTLSLMQVINRRLQMALTADLAYQDGYLATSFNRVFFTDGSMLAENLPSKRLKTPIGIRANYFAGDKVVLRSFYRFYRDDWGMKAHTLSLEVPVKVNSAFSVSPNYRFHTQTAINHFAAYWAAAVGSEFFTSDYDLSGFQSHFAGMGFRYAPAETLMIPHFNMLEFRADYFSRSDGMSAWITSVNLRFK